MPLHTANHLKQTKPFCPNSKLLTPKRSTTRMRLGMHTRGPTGISQSLPLHVAGSAPYAYAKDTEAIMPAACLRVVTTGGHALRLQSPCTMMQPGVSPCTRTHGPNAGRGRPYYLYLWCWSSTHAGHCSSLAGARNRMNAHAAQPSILAHAWQQVKSSRHARTRPPKKHAQPDLRPCMQRHRPPGPRATELRPT